MFGKKLVVSVFAVAAVYAQANAAASLKQSGAVSTVTGPSVNATAPRAGTLRIQPGQTSQKSVSGARDADSDSSSYRMSTITGLANMTTKPKLPASASAETVADLKDQLDNLADDIAAMQNAGVDETEVLKILESELSDRNYATYDYVDNADSALLPSADFDSKFDARATEKQLVDEDKLGDYAKTSDVLSTNVTFTKSGDYIQMTDHGVTKNVVLLSDIKGEKGEKGADGTVDETQLNNAVNSAIDNKNLMTESDKNALESQISGVRSEMDSKLDKAEFTENANTWAESQEKLVSKTELDQYKTEVDESIRNATANLSNNENITQLRAQVDAHETAINNLSNDHVDKTTYNTDKAGLQTSLDGKLGKDDFGTYFNYNVQANNLVKESDLDYYAKEADLSALGARVDTLGENKADKDSVYTKEEVIGIVNNAKPNVEMRYDSDNNQLLYKDANGEWQSLDIQGLTGEDGEDGCTPQFNVTEGENEAVINITECGNDIHTTIPYGEKGDKGDKGDTGDTGAQGLQGEKGEKGDKGDKGDPGDTGAQGLQGEKGDTGAQGPQGDKGDQGEKGEKGDQGEKGEKGEKGDKGDKGDPGDPLCATIRLDTIGENVYRLVCVTTKE